jgi:hypothetical protein
MFDESLPVIGDWEFNIRFLMKYDVLVIKESLANYHVRTDAKKEYENTVTAQKDTHAFYRALIINKHIRDDLQSGHLTKGDLLSAGDYFHRISGTTMRVARLIDTAKALPFVSFLRKIFRR